MVQKQVPPPSLLDPHFNITKVQFNNSQFFVVKSIMCGIRGQIRKGGGGGSRWRLRGRGRGGQPGSRGQSHSFRVGDGHCSLLIKLNKDPPSLPPFTPLNLGLCYVFVCKFKFFVIRIFFPIEHLKILRGGCFNSPR